MATKKGLAFYRMDTDKYQDMKIKKLRKDFKRDGVAVFDYILCEIYRVEGCFIVWDESTAFDVADYWELKETTVNEIVNYCCAVGLFNKGLFTSERVLSSLAIQRRYVEMCTVMKRKVINIPEKYLIVPEESPQLPEVLPIIREDFYKVEKSKVKESKEEESKGGIPPDLLKSNLFRQPKIPTIEEVDRVFIQQGGTMDMALKFFNKHSSVGWYLNGSPITNFSNLVPGFISNWNKNYTGPVKELAKPGMLSSMVAQAEEQELRKKQAS